VPFKSLARDAIPIDVTLADITPPLALVGIDL